MVYYILYHILILLIHVVSHFISPSNIVNTWYITFYITFCNIIFYITFHITFYNIAFYITFFCGPHGLTVQMHVGWRWRRGMLVCSRRGAHSEPYALHLHPTPYTLNGNARVLAQGSELWTLRPTPYTVNLNPKPYPYTLHPKRECSRVRAGEIKVLDEGSFEYFFSFLFPRRGDQGARRGLGNLRVLHQNRAHKIPLFKTQGSRRDQSGQVPLAPPPPYSPRPRPAPPSPSPRIQPGYAAARVQLKSSLK